MLTGLGLVAGVLLALSPWGQHPVASGLDQTSTTEPAAPQWGGARTASADEPALDEAESASAEEDILRGIEVDWTLDDRIELQLDEEERAAAAYERRLETNLVQLEAKADAAEAEGNTAYADALRARAEAMLRRG